MVCASLLQVYIANKCWIFERATRVEITIQRSSFTTTRRVLTLLYADSNPSTQEAQEDLQIDGVNESSTLDRTRIYTELLANRYNMKASRMPQLNKFYKELELALDGRKDPNIGHLLNELEIYGSGQYDEMNNAEEILTYEEFQKKLKARYVHATLDAWILKAALKDNESLRMGRLTEEFFYGIFNVSL